MATVKIKFRASTVEHGVGTVYFQIIQGRVIRQIGSELKVLTEEWDEKKGTVRTLGCESVERQLFLQAVAERLRWKRMLLCKIMDEMQHAGRSNSADDIVREFRKREAHGSVCNLLQRISERLMRLSRIRTAETYTATLRSFMRFRKGEDVPLESFNSNLMVEYEAWLKASGVALNTISFYMRRLRSVYNRAVENGLTEQRWPFRHVYTGKEKTKKRAIPLEAIRRIKNLDLRMSPKLCFARNMFLFSFYMRGMSFVDMCFLRKEDLKNGILSYRRHKTGQRLVMRWETEMQMILQKYSSGSESPYLLNIIRMGANERRQYETAMHLVNSRLKEVARLADVQANLTMYVARHSWASIARSKNIPLAVISEGLGHESEKTTQIYLDSIDTSAVDSANRKIIRYL